MTQEEKELLLKDLSARLPYGVNCQFIWTYCNETTDGEDVIANEEDYIRCIDIRTNEILSDYYGEWVDLEHCKPYLRPMSSMTEEEKEEYEMFEVYPGFKTNHTDLTDMYDWLNKNHFDYRGLIPMGLALGAPEGMYEN